MTRTRARTSSAREAQLPSRSLPVHGRTFLLSKTRVGGWLTPFSPLQHVASYLIGRLFLSNPLYQWHFAF